jgi:hypothetical protein
VRLLSSQASRFCSRWSEIGIAQLVPDSDNRFWRTQVEQTPASEDLEARGSPTAIIWHACLTPARSQRGVLALSRCRAPEQSGDNQIMLHGTKRQ